MRAPPLGQPPVAFRELPLRFLVHLHEQHGDVVLAELDGTPTVFCGGATGPAELFRAERASLRVLNTDLVNDLFGSAIFNLTGERHLAARRMVLSGLRGAHLPWYARDAVRLALAHVGRWATAPMDLYQAARALTMSACARMILGLDDEAELNALFDIFVTGSLLPSADRHARPEYWQAMRSAAELRSLLRRRAESARAAPGTDLLSRMVAHGGPRGAADADLPDHLLAILVATRETTASLITWMLVELSRAQSAAAAMASEAAAFLADPGSLADHRAGPALRAVLTESERLHSPNAIGLRTVMSHCRIGGYDVECGWNAAYSPAANHLMPSLFDQPGVFRPERFTGMFQDPGVSMLLTFGSGTHACPGRHLAEIVTLATASAVLARYTLSLAGDVTADISYLPVKAPRSPVTVRLEPL
jgi:cytochrome P450